MRNQLPEAVTQQEKNMKIYGSFYKIASKKKDNRANVIMHKEIAMWSYVTSTTKVNKTNNYIFHKIC